MHEKAIFLIFCQDFTDYEVAFAAKVTRFLFSRWLSPLPDAFGFEIVPNRRGILDMQKANKILLSKSAGQSQAGEKPRDWRRAMSDNVAYALLVYTGLQIFVTVHAMKEGSSSTLPYLALVVLIAGIIPACRWFERRWRDLDDDAAADVGHRPAFRRDLTALWLIAIGLPFLLTGIYKAVVNFA